MARSGSAGAALPLPVVDLRPQSVLLSFFGDYVSDPRTAVSAASVVHVLDGAGVGVHATRATLSRMVSRGLLRREAQGRQAFFGLTEFGLRTVLDGRQRTQEADVVDRGWDGRWTMVSFSLPEDSQRKRHDLRSRLSWAGFGMVNAGLWAAPHDVDVVALLKDLGVLDGVRAFSGVPASPSDGSQLVRDLYDLDAIAATYDAFVQRWAPFDGAVGAVGDALVARIVLAADWLLVVRHDPRLPVEFLPPEWPGHRALDLQRRLVAVLTGPSEQEALERLDIRVLGAE